MAVGLKKRFRLCYWGWNHKSLCLAWFEKEERSINF